jgi:hypothetical protein
MKIALVTIATGKYNIFVPDLVRTAEDNFLPGLEKHYFIFSDTCTAKDLDSNNISIIPQEKLGWPFDTMMRFHMFLSIKEELEKFDYVFFLNANLIFSKEIRREDLKLHEGHQLLGVQHPGFYLTNRSKFPYERNPDVSCNIPPNEGDFYFQGCFNGGRSSEWIEMCHTLSGMIELDLSKNLIPIWHDESYLNWYFKEKGAKVLPPSYGIPEQIIDGDFNWWDSGYKNLQLVEHYIIQRDKRKYGGSDFLRS